MKQYIVHSSPREVRRYRQIKLAMLVPLIGVTALYGFNRPTPQHKEEALSHQPLVSTVADFREDWPLQLRLDKPSPSSLPLGTYVLEGKGPLGASATLFDGDERVLTTPIAEDGHWRAAVKVNEGGVVTFRVDMRRGQVPVGRATPLTLVFSDGKITKGSDLKITSVGPYNKIWKGEITLRGFAPPADFVRVYVGSVELGRAEVDTEGHWELDAEINTPGKRSLSIVDEITRHGYGPIPIIVTPR